MSKYSIEWIPLGVLVYPRGPRGKAKLRILVPRLMFSTVFHTLDPQKVLEQGQGDQSLRGFENFQSFLLF